MAERDAIGGRGWRDDGGRLSPTRIHLYAKNVDMRKSFDGLHAIIQSEFQRDVRLGDLFLFLNRRRDRLKLTYWDRDGLAIWMKRLER
ncbi:MAG TPA: IS66 family insertion sequence element accessory protein TnpB [Pirellulales bacterium]|nr:IS66 family insertion sequence element accessory protein TnpB [Pirellulales bacterium]